MKKTIEKLRRASEALLDNDEVREVIGWRKGRFFWQGSPCFTAESGQVDSLDYPVCATVNLSKYLMDMARDEQPSVSSEDDEPEAVALWTRGCEARAVNRLIADGVIDREAVYLLGFSCPGVVDDDKLRQTVGQDSQIEEALWADDETGNRVISVSSGPDTIEVTPEEVLQDRCLRCTHPEPVIYDQLISDDGSQPASEEERFSQLLCTDGGELDERYQYWSEHFDRCIRCYACRNVCPACNCTECVFDSGLPQQPDWLSKASTLSEKSQFHLIRMFHVAGRCIECGACEEVCPVNLPLSELMLKPAADIDELFGPHQAGLSDDEIPPLQTYELDDPGLDMKGGGTDDQTPQL